MNLSDLPNTVYDMVLVAIDGARELDRSLYRPHYGDWHAPQDHGLCAICLAGAVLAGPLGCSPIEEAKP